MIRSDPIFDTIRMFQEEHLDVRTVTLGLDLQDCSSPVIQHVRDKVHAKIVRHAGHLGRATADIERRFGIPVVNRRIAVSPMASVAAGHRRDDLIALAGTLDAAAGDVGVDLIGGYSALVHKHSTPTARALIDSLPEALASTERVCASVNVASTRAGINMDAVLQAGRTVRAIADADADHHGFACAKLVVFANMPDDNPFMAGAVHGQGEADAVVNIGVSGPGVVARALQRLIDHVGPEHLTLADVAEEIKITAFRVTRVGELIGRELAHRLGVAFGIVDLSLAPTPKVGDSIGEILQTMGVVEVGAPGSTAAIALRSSPSWRTPRSRRLPPTAA
jgi:uncharacterized protein (UPF0210 family)